MPPDCTREQRRRGKSRTNVLISWSFLQMTLVIPIWDAMVARFILLIWKMCIRDRAYNEATKTFYVGDSGNYKIRKIAKEQAPDDLGGEESNDNQNQENQ